MWRAGVVNGRQKLAGLWVLNLPGPRQSLGAARSPGALSGEDQSVASTPTTVFRAVQMCSLERLHGKFLKHCLRSFTKLGMKVRRMNAGGSPQPWERVAARC